VRGAPGRARRGPEPWQCAGARASGGDAGRSPPAGGWGRYSRKMVRNTAVLQWILPALASTAFRIARWRSIAERDKSARVRDQRSRRDQELQDTMATARAHAGRLPRGGRAGGREGARARRRRRQGGSGRRCSAHSVCGRSSRRWRRGKSFCSQIFAPCTVSFCIDCGAGLMVGCRCSRNRCCRRDGAFGVALSPCRQRSRSDAPTTKRLRPADGGWAGRLSRLFGVLGASRMDDDLD
jgi:hypothetical protein